MLHVSRDRASGEGIFPAVCCTWLFHLHGSSFVLVCSTKCVTKTLVAEKMGHIDLTCLYIKRIRLPIRLTSLASLLLGAVDVVLELDAALSLIGQFSDKGMLEELLCAGPLVVVFHQTALNE